MSQIMVDTNLCKRDGVCVAVCPSGVLGLNEERLPEEVPGGNCILCGHCVAVCDAMLYPIAACRKNLFCPSPMNCQLRQSSTVS